MGIILSWIIFSFIVGFIGAERKIGFWGAFLLSLFLSPILGIIVTLVSKDKQEEAYKKELLKIHQHTATKLSNIDNTNQQSSVIENLEKIKNLKDEGVISEQEFTDLKTNLLSNKKNFQKKDNIVSNKQNSINGFQLSLSEINVPNRLKNELKLSDNDLLYQIKESGKYMQYYECKEYPFFVALELDRRNVKIPQSSLATLLLIAKFEFDSGTINEVFRTLP